MTCARGLALLVAAVTLLAAASPAAAQPPRTRDLPRAANPSAQLHTARTLVERALAIRLARLPARLNMEKFQRWASRTFRRFIETKRAAIDAADRAIQPLAQAPDRREHLIAAALTGVMYDDFALRIRALPAPLELQRDAQLAAAYRSALESVVAPLAQRALAAYQVCTAQPDLAPDWAAFCQARITIVTPVASGAP